MERCPKRPWRASSKLHPRLQTRNPMLSSSAPPLHCATHRWRMLEHPGARAGIRPTFPLKRSPLKLPRAPGLREIGRTPDVAEHASTSCLSRIHGLVQESQCHAEFLLPTTLCFHTRADTLPAGPRPQPPATTRLHAGWTSQGLEEEEGVRAQGPGRETAHLGPGSPSLAHPRTQTSGPAAQTWPPPTRRRRRRRLSAERRGGAGGSAADRPAGGDGRGIDRLATRAAARAHTTHTHTHRPSSRGHQRGPGKREEPASARPAVGRPVRSARRPPALEVGSWPPGRWCPG